MPNYLKSEIADILLTFEVCQVLYRSPARYYRRHFPGKLHYPNYERIRIIERKERDRPRIYRIRGRIMNNDCPRILVVFAMADLHSHISFGNIQRYTGITR